jgi:CubicO group peptidase (beta-lactamase class C family)
MLSHKSLRRISYLSAILFLFITASAAPQQTSAKTIAGHWEGAIELPTGKLAIDVDFTKTADGPWTGDISIPAQNLKDYALAKIEFNEKDISFELPNIPGTPAFKGTLGANGASIEGKFTQGGQAFSFSLRRAESPAAKTRAALAKFDAVVEAGLKSLKVPGAAVAVIAGGEVVLAKGYGFRDAEKKLPMTPDTLMAIGSSSKAFTTFALGTLVDEGRMEWDKPVRTYIPWFKLYDPSATERITPRDLVTHRSGLPRHDLVWYNNFTSSREDLVRRLAFLKPTADLREKFQYNNLMFLTAGFLLEQLTGKRWEDAVRTRVLAPLGMTRTNFSVEDSQKDADFAWPYREEKGAFVRIPFRNITTVGPAGSINSSVNEMSRWLRVHLNRGTIDGKTILNAATVSDMHSPHMPVGAPQAQPEIGQAVYGLGWFIDSYRGHARVHHGGNIDGFSALVSFLPQDGIGYVILTKMNGTPLGELLVRHATDMILGLPVRNWILEAAANRAKGEEVGKAAEQKKSKRRTPGTKPAHKLEDYAGDYNHPGYGDLKVVLRDGRLSFVYNGIAANLDHWHYETFLALKIDDPTFDQSKMTFRTNANGFIEAVEAPFEATLEDIVFMRKPEARLSDPAFLKQLEGVYDTGTQRITLTLKGTGLVASIPGQPAFDLQPALGGEFVLKQAPGIGLKFAFDDKGRVTGADLIQPGGVFSAKKVKD